MKVLALLVGLACCSGKVELFIVNIHTVFIPLTNAWLNIRIFDLIKANYFHLKQILGEKRMTVNYFKYFFK